MIEVIISWKDCRKEKNKGMEMEERREKPMADRERGRERNK